MLKVRIIPTLLWKGTGLVKGMGFDSWRRVGTVLPAIKVYNLREVDELVILDITATNEGKEPDYETIADWAQECFVPVTIGGGIRNLEQIRRLLKCGADKIAINSAAYERPQLISEASNRFGSQCVVVSIDARKTSTGDYECYSHSGKRPTGMRPAEWAKRCEALGAGELLITSMERDGTMLGYDLELVQQVANEVKIPVIASGGAGSPLHMLQAIQRSASAVAAASMFHFTEQTPAECRDFLLNHGIPVRKVAG
ncbi:MAG: imidazole glycerol phosphate synthase cyclase subunit [Dissulfuribacterales bacterium]